MTRWVIFMHLRKDLLSSVPHSSIRGLSIYFSPIIYLYFILLSGWSEGLKRWHAGSFLCIWEQICWALCHIQVLEACPFLFLQFFISIFYFYLDKISIKFGLSVSTLSRYYSDSKAELPQVGILFHTQFPSLGIFINKKIGFRKN